MAQPHLSRPPVSTDFEIRRVQLDDVVEPSRFARAAVGVAHRVLSLGLILLLAGIGAAAAGKGASSLLLWAFASGDAALLSGSLALAAERRRLRTGREALVIVWMALGVIILSVGAYFISRKLRGV